MDTKQLTKSIRDYYKKYDNHQFSTIKSVKEALERGKDVRWFNDGYKCYVEKGKVLLIYMSNGFICRLTYSEVCCCYLK